MKIILGLIGSLIVNALGLGGLELDLRRSPLPGTAVFVMQLPSSDETSAYARMASRQEPGRNL
jgi:hypothetical protein